MRTLLLTAAVIASVASALGLWLKSTPIGEAIELRLYDIAVRARASQEPTTNPIVLVTYPDKLLDDPDFWPHPVPDRNLAELFTKLVESGAVAVGVDIFRGTPVPKGSTDPALDEALTNLPNIVMVSDVLNDSPTTQPPPVLGGDRLRIAASNVPDDGGLAPGIRRAYIAFEKDGQPLFSLGFLTALQFLWWTEQLPFEPIPTEDPDHPNHYRLGERTIIPFDGDDGPYAGSADDNFQILLDFAHHQPFTADYDFKTFMEAPPEDAAEMVGGKLVLVGIVAKSVQDEHPTPLSDRQRGLHGQAGLADQILDLALDPTYRPTRFLPDVVESAIVVGMAILGAVIALVVRRVSFVVPLVAVLVIAPSVIAHFALREKWWVPTVAASVAALVGAGGTVAASRFLLSKKSGQLEDVLKSHLGERTFELVWSDREELLETGQIAATKTTATIMMTDLRGFSKVSEKLDQETLHAWLRRYMQAMEVPIKAHDGMIKSYIGDAIYAVWGLGKNEEGESADCRTRALNCAVDMGVALAELNANFAREGLPQAGMRVGVHTGSVMIGTFGGSDTVEYGIIGDSVNTAARLESFDKDKVGRDLPCRVITSSATFTDDIAGLYKSEPIGDVKLSGMDKTVTAYLILAKT